MPIRYDFTGFFPFERAAKFPGEGNFKDIFKTDGFRVSLLRSGVKNDANIAKWYGTLRYIFWAFIYEWVLCGE